MLGKTHKVGGISAATITSTALYVGGYPLIQSNPEMIPLIIAGGWLGGMMPDIDHPNSTISNAKIFGIPIFKPIAILINMLFGHRGATHMIWSLYLTWLPFILAPLFLSSDMLWLSSYISMFGIGYAVGYLSHLFLDALTPTGAPIFWPLPNVRLAKLTTGKYDRIVRIVLIASTIMISGGMLYYIN